MGEENKKIEKHIGEQRPITQNDPQSDRAESNADSGDSNQSTNPLKPIETQKGVNGDHTHKK